jgi:hypothetical protein
MNRQLIQKHRVNPKCNCTVCFVKETMDKTGASYDDALKAIFTAQEEGLLTIEDYDVDGFPTEIKRNVTAKKLKEVLKKLED